MDGSKLECCHCAYLERYRYQYDDDYIVTYECKLDHPDADIFKDACDDFKPSFVTNGLYVRGAFKMPLEEWLDKSPIEWHTKLLDRLYKDCINYIIHKNQDTTKIKLWAGTPEEEIKAMRTIFNYYPDDRKPNWITEGDIDSHAVAMGVK